MQVSESTPVTGVAEFPSSGRDAAAEIEDLVRRVVGRISAATGDAAGQPAGEPQEIILDIDVDGSRYLLVRMARASRISAGLSPREREIVRMVADGHPNKIIAGVLNISPWTVCTHLRRIFAKLGVNSRAALVSRLLEIRASSRDSGNGRAEQYEMKLGT